MARRITKRSVMDPNELVRLLEAIDTELDALRTLANEVRTDRATILTGTTTWNPGNLADGAGETKAVTVTGAALGDIAIACLDKDISEMVISAHVSAADTVEVRLQNETTGAVDVADGNVYVMVIPTTAFTNTAAAVTEQVDSGNA